MVLNTVVTILIAMVCLAYGTMKAALYIHHNLLHYILRAPMDFFDTTPKGRIISRFSTDINIIDYNLPMSLRQILAVFFRVGLTNKCLTKSKFNLDKKKGNNQMAFIQDM